jgi:glutathione S-transferase
MLRLYDFWESGNCYKVRLLLTQLGIPFERIAVDILRDETRTDDFRRLNANQRVPLLEWPDGRRLAESNAIVWHLAENTALAPADPWERAQTLQWMFFEQYSHEPYIAVMKFWKFWGGLHHKRPDEIAVWQQRGQAALAVMNTHLTGRSYFVGDAYSIADIALYAYTHTADVAGFDLEATPAVRAWLARVRSQPGHVPIEGGT